MSVGFNTCFLSLRPTLFLVQSRSLSGRHVSTSFLDPVLGAMMKQVCCIRGAPRLTEACPRYAWQPQGCCACVGQAVVCRASFLHLSLLRQKLKNAIEDIHLALATNPRVLLGSCAPSSAVSVAGGWWVAAVGFCCCLAAISLMWLLAVSWWVS